MQQRVTDAVAEHMCWAELLAPRIKPIQTGVTVLTGTQCAGKTTMTRKLHEQGIPIIPESIREIFEEGLTRGIPLNELKHAMPEVISTCLSRHVRNVIRSHESGCCSVSDRGIGDLLGGMTLLRHAASAPKLFRALIPLVLGGAHYWNFLQDKDLPEIKWMLDRQIDHLKSWAKIIHYERILWLAPMPHLVKDALRAENPLTRKIISSCIRNSWHELGYKLEYVPACYRELDRRVEIVLSLLPKQGSVPSSRFAETALTGPKTVF